MADDILTIEKYGGDIIASKGMQAEKEFLQHGNVSTFEHSVSVTKMCLRLSRGLHISIDERSLIRGALLHDYYLYDWHKPHAGNDLHAFSHAAKALRNASRDFCLNEIERDMIQCHMFPLTMKPPRFREGAILCLADKICALWESCAGISRRTSSSGAARS